MCLQVHFTADAMICMSKIPIKKKASLVEQVVVKVDQELRMRLDALKAANIVDVPEMIRLAIKRDLERAENQFGLKGE